MTARKWMPGDVAVLRVGQFEGVAIRHIAGWSLGAPIEGSFDYYDKDGISKAVRPLVVIDPEDRDQVRSLVRRFFRHMGDDVNVPSEWHEECMAAALRGRGPKPPEPMGFGALVEDSAGVLWISFRRDPNEEHEAPWCASHSDRLDLFADYVDIDVVEVKFESVLS